MSRCACFPEKAEVRMVVECTSGDVVEVWMCRTDADAFVDETKRKGRLIDIQKFHGIVGRA